MIPMTHAVQSALSCVVCTELFRVAPSPHVPKMMRCGHTVCEECLTTLAASEYNRCPTCRKDIDIMCTNLMLGEYGEKFFQQLEARKAELEAKRKAAEAERAAVAAGAAPKAEAGDASSTTPETAPAPAVPAPPAASE